MECFVYKVLHFQGGMYKIILTHYLSRTWHFLMADEEENREMKYEKVTCLE